MFFYLKINVFNIYGFSLYLAAVLRHKANDGGWSLRYHTVWSGISSYCVLS